jgi:hypothetical protein
MIFAFGRIVAMNRRSGKLLGILSMKRGAPERRCILASAR